MFRSLRQLFPPIWKTNAQVFEFFLHFARNFLSENMAKICIRLVHYLFRMICISISLYLVLKQIERYQENLDTPKISFKELNKSPGDVYPEFTICVEGYPSEHEIYDHPTSIGTLNKHQYHGILTGTSKRWKKKPDVTGIDFIKDTGGNKTHFLRNYYMIYDNGDKDNINLLERTYHIPGTICSTRQSKRIREGLFVSFEHINVDMTNAQMQLFIHYPGQVLRTVFFNDRKHRSILTKNTDDFIGNQTRLPVAIHLSQMSVVKRRQVGVIPCTPHCI